MYARGLSLSLMLICVLTTMAVADGFIALVPDASQPPNLPLWLPHVANYCSPMAAVNVTQYWDVIMLNPRARFVNGNPPMGTQIAAPYIGWWMDTNNHGCLYRANGAIPSYPPGNGTYVGDLAPGLAQYVRWDAANNFGCSPPPLPVVPLTTKNGYPWTVVTTDNLAQTANAAWTQMTAEIDNGRPCLVTFSYWNPVNKYSIPGPNGEFYYDWGAVISSWPSPDEEWNYPTNPDSEYDGIPYGPQTIGHTVTAVGYRTNFDPDGPGIGGPLPQANWVICHDNWLGTPVNVAIPWRRWLVGGGGLQWPLWSPWVANTLVKVGNPPIGTLTVAPGPKNPGNHCGLPSQTNIMAQIRFTANATEGAVINSITLNGSGTGLESTDILTVQLVDDANSNGKVDPGELGIATGIFPPGLRTATIVIPGPSTYVVPAGGHRDMLVIYMMSANPTLGGTLIFTVPAAGVSATGSTSFLPLTINGLPFTSATKTIMPGPVIVDVPDTNPPLQDPLGTGDVTNYCAPTAAENIIEYWDVVMKDAKARFVNGNPFLGSTTVPGYIGYWMDTNDDGCPFRANGTAFGSGNGTYVADLAPGVAQYARWDANNLFGCTPPPNVFAGKSGYSWTVATVDNQALAAFQGWVAMMGEIDAGRPVMVAFCYWNPVNGWLGPDGITYYTWGPLQDPPPENWNHPLNPDPEYGGIPFGLQTIGHAVTAIGYFANYDPDGAGALPQVDWVVVHDNWPTTAKDMAIPWRLIGVLPWSPWVSNTSIDINPPVAPVLDAWNGPFDAVDHWALAGCANVMSQIAFTAGAQESVVLDGVKLKASGTGNDNTDITKIELVDDADNDGQFDVNETVIASCNGGYDADDGSRTILISPKPNYQFVIPAGGTKPMLVVYTMAVGLARLNTYSFSLSAYYATGQTTYLPAGPAGLWVPYISCTKTIGVLSDMLHKATASLKSEDDGTLVATANFTEPAIVTTNSGTLGKMIYIQDQNRAAGIQINFGTGPVPTFEVGNLVRVNAAYIDTINGERALVQPIIQLVNPSTTAPKPVGLKNVDNGGGGYGFNPATGAGQKGVTGGAGLNNIGLLVKMWGRFEWVTPNEFLINDGSNTPVRCRVPAGSTLPLAWQHSNIYVCVTGICSGYPDGNNFLRQLYVRALDDIQPTYLPP